MNSLDVYTARELRNQSGSILKDAERGRISLVTKHGKPAFLTIPFDERLLHLGLNRDLAVVLFKNGLISLSKAATLASLALEEFIDVLGELGIDSVDYPPDELLDEMTVEF